MCGDGLIITSETEFEKEWMKHFAGHNENLTGYLKTESDGSPFGLKISVEKKEEKF